MNEENENMKLYGVPFEPTFKFGDLKGKRYSDIELKEFYSVYQQAEWIQIHFGAEIKRRRSRKPIDDRNDPVISFGKHRGECLHELPDDYLLYNLKVSGHDLPVMRKYIEAQERRNAYPGDRRLAHS